MDGSVQPAHDQSRESDAATDGVSLPGPGGHGPAPAAPVSGPGGQVGITTARRFMRMVWRRKLIVLATIAVVVGMAGLLLARMETLYEARATLLVDVERSAGGTASGPGGREVAVETEAAIIGSYELATQVLDPLALLDDAAYNPTLRPADGDIAGAILDPLVDAIAGLFLGARAAAPPGRLATADTEVERAHLVREYAITAHLARLAVEVRPGTQVVAVRYASADPGFAALAANATAQSYVTARLTGAIAPPRDGTEGLTRRITEARVQIDAAERKLSDFRRQAGAAALGDAGANQQQLAQLNQELALARVQRAEAEARLQSAERALQAGGVDSGGLDSTVIQGLRSQEAEVLRRLSELSTQYRERHPLMIQARTDLEGVRGRIAVEQRKVVGQLGETVRLAQVRERNLSVEIDRIAATLRKQSGAAIDIQTLEGEAEAARRLYESLTARLAATAGDRGEASPPPDIRIISTATIPTVAFFPPTAALLAAAFALSLVLGIALAALVEYLDQGFRTKSHLETMTGLAVLGMVPFMRGMERSGQKPHEVALDKPNSTYGAAIRGLRTALLLVRGGARPRSIMITSSIPGEGKTSTSLAIACSAAKSGLKVMILECDILRPTMHKALGVPREGGLSEYLEGVADIQDVVRIDRKSGVHYVVAGADRPHGSDLLASAKMARLVNVLAETYDLVVIDSPPVMAVSDTIALAHMADETLYLVRWAKTPREIAYAGIRMILESGSRLGGLALTKVDVKKHARHQYGRAGYHYYGAYEKYHTDK